MKKLLLLGVVALLAACGGTKDIKGPTADTSASSSSSAETSTEPDADTSSEPPAPKALGKGDFTITLKIKSKTCYGDGVGCSLEYEPKLAINGNKPAEEDSYEVSYSVTGCEDGAQIGTLTTHGGRYEDNDFYHSCDTPSSATKLKVKITQVEKQT